MIIQSVKKLKILLLLLPAIFFLLYCEDTEKTLRERATRIRDKDNDPIRTTGSEEYYGEYSSSDYEGATCKSLRKEEGKEKDYEKCKEICKKMYNNDADDCEKVATELIFELEQLFTSMTRIRANEDQLNRRVDGFNFGVMIDISVEPVLELLKDWSEREVKEFLIWTAMNSPISLALKHHDNSNKILKTSFRKVGTGHGSGDARVEYGFGEDLQGGGKTFLVIANDAKNPSAFNIAYRLVESICLTNFKCIFRWYCVREEFESARRRQCRYSSEKRGFNRDRHCYIHGPDVWSYWTHLKDEENMLKRNRIYFNNFKMNEETCNGVCRTCPEDSKSWCGNQNCKREI